MLTRASRVFLGFGTNIDVEAQWDNQVFQRLLEDSTLSCPTRNILRNIAVTIANGDGGEFSIDVHEILHKISTEIHTSRTLGGTGARASIILGIYGVPHYLHVPGDPSDLQSLFSPAAEVISSPLDNATTSPHLIFQYPKGACLQLDGKEFVAPRSNRIILTSDYVNEVLPISEQVIGMLRECRLILLSGLNAIRDNEILRDRLNQIGLALRGRSRESLVVYEDAGFHNENLHQSVLSFAENNADLISLNEDEFNALLGCKLNFSDLNEIPNICSLVRKNFAHSSVILHTSTWAVAIGEMAHYLGDALDYGVATASTRYLKGDHLTASDVENTLQQVHQASKFYGDRIDQRLASDDDFRISFAPDLGAADNPTTIGLGDAFIGGLIRYLALEKK